MFSQDVVFVDKCTTTTTTAAAAAAVLPQIRCMYVILFKSRSLSLVTSIVNNKFMHST